MADRKIVYCPKCGRRVAEYDGRATMNVIAKCGYCKKRVVYNVSEKKTEIKDMPPRTTSSGMRFI